MLASSMVVKPEYIALLKPLQEFDWLKNHSSRPSLEFSLWPIKEVLIVRELSFVFISPNAFVFPYRSTGSGESVSR